jgi:glycosyltransferase involved in cell wall biosynthesis
VKTSLERTYWELKCFGTRNSLFHSIYHRRFPIKQIPMVATIHDMIFEKFTDMFGAAWNAERRKKAVVAHEAVRCVAISQQTKRDLCDIYNIPPEKVDVVPHGVNPLDFNRNEVVGETEFLRRAGVERGSYLLYVGGRENHKNFRTLLKAYAGSPLSGSLPLLVVGLPWSRVEEELIARTQTARRVQLLISPSTSQLAILYRNAAVFVYPSLYEGFGLPILEAMACGAPVALSHAGPLPEVGGTAAEYFDPRDETSMIAAIETLLDPEHAKTRRARGFDRAKLFTWDETVRLTIECYRKVLSRA